MQVTLKQFIENGFMLRIEIGHDRPFQYNKLIKGSGLQHTP